MNKFVRNTYFYVCLSFLICYLTLMYMENKDKNVDSFIVPFIFSFVMLFLIYYIDDKIFNHIVWVLFLISIAYFSYPIYKKHKEEGKLNSILLASSLVVLVVSIYGYYTKKNLDSWGSYLLWGLIALIIFQLVDLFINKKRDNTKENVYGYVGIVLFTMFLLYDTTRLNRIKVDDSNVLYTRSSLNIFLDILNLITSFGRTN